MGHLYEMKGVLITGIIVFIFLLVLGIFAFSNFENDSEKEAQENTNINSESELAPEVNETTEDELIDIRTSEDVFSLIDESVDLLS